MLKQLEGSQGVAQAVALCRPDVVCAYPISPQTHIVENLGLLCRKGVLQNCEYINVESEFAALSVAIGASIAGGRAYTATAYFKKKHETELENYAIYRDKVKAVMPENIKAIY